jgi:hypothetical protein
MRVAKAARRVRLFPTFLVALASAVAAGCGGQAPVTTAAARTTGTGQPEESLASVWESLHKGADFTGCRGAVQQLNDYLSRAPEDRPAAQPSAERDLLAGLAPDELAEVGSPTFTLLDAHYLESSLLLRDVLSALQVGNASPLDKASAAFDWTVRQVRLREKPGPILPVAFVLRRASGTSMERAVVFLALLHQLGVDGCMLAVPGPTADNPGHRFWIPAAVVGKDVYLFDPRLGLPIPGPGGKGVATLAQIRTQPDILKALSPDDKRPYDVSAEQLKGVELYLLYHLSAWSPRMRWLQEKFPAAQRINLGIEPVSSFERLQAVVKEKGHEGCAAKVASQTGGPMLALRNFLPAEEGGTDKSHRRDQAAVELVPWNVLPRSVADVPGQPGKVLREAFARQTIGFYLDPKMPRDLVLRGRYDDAISQLVKLRESLRKQRSAVPNESDFEARLAVWQDRAAAVYADLLRAEEQATKSGSQGAVTVARGTISAFWKENLDILVMLQSLAAEPLNSEATYQLALSKHEVAERSQADLDRTRQAGKTPSPSDDRKAKEAWKAAAEWWETFLEEFPAAVATAEARIYRARALEQLGQKEAAVALLQSAPPEANPLQATARLLFLQRLQSR